MTSRALDWIAPVVAAAGLVGALAVFAVERRSFRDAVIGWARHDLSERTDLASSALREPLETGNFAAIHAFGESCASDGVRLTVTSRAGGLVFDSVARNAVLPESIYETRPCGEWQVRLGLPLSRVLAPFTRAGSGFILAALVGGAGVLLVFLSTYRQRVRYRELARVERFRREFVADVSHEIKTPLTGILGAADLLGDAEGDPGLRRRLTAMIKSESARLNALAQDILNLARLERDGEPLNRTPADLAGIVRETVERLEPEADAKGVRVATSLPDGACVASVDVELVSQALANLIANAIRHSGSTDVLVSLVHGQARRPLKRPAAVLSVEDHGVGIPASARAHVFERFYRVDPARASSSGGAGLGLAIVRRIARLHGGDVNLEPIEPSGCRFSMTLPA